MGTKSMTAAGLMFAMIFSAFAGSEPPEKPADSAKWSEVKTLSTKTQVGRLTFSADGKALYASPGADVLHYWDTTTWDVKKIERPDTRFIGITSAGKPMGIDVGPMPGKAGRVLVRLIDWQTAEVECQF